MTAHERSQAIIQDIAINHLPRIAEGLKKGYVDENQILVMYDHAVRARILEEIANAEFADDASRIVEHIDNLTKINRELAAEMGVKEVKGTFRKKHVDPGESKPVNAPSPDADICAPNSIIKGVGYSGHITYVTHVAGMSTEKIMHGSDRKDAFVMVEATANGVCDYLNRVCGDVNFEIERVDTVKVVPSLQCPCGGLVKDYPAFPESMLKCEQCGRVYMDEDEVATAQKTERMKGERLPDATYWTTGTVAGTEAVPLETEINLNGSKTTISAVDGKFVLTYEQIVRMAINLRRSRLDRFDGTDAELPMYTCTYSHRVAMTRQWHEKPHGILHRGQSLECTPGMAISCMDTGNA